MRSLIALLGPGARQRRIANQAVQRALAEQIKGNFQTALGHWETVLARYPHLPAAYRGVASCARALGQLDYAERIIEVALQQFPEDRSVIAEAAQIEERAGNWAACVELWEKIVDSPGVDVWWLHGYAHALLILGRLDKVDSLLTNYQQRFPDHSGFLALQGMSAAARQDFDRSLDIWRVFRERFPDDPTGWENYGRALHAVELARLDEASDIDEVLGTDVPAPVKIELVKDQRLRALLLNFESIGCDCEFGLVQRRYGAEPLGLLRFNATTVGGLVLAASHRFRDMGNPDVTEIFFKKNGEYRLKDRRWGLWMHTFTFKGQVDPDLLYSKFCRRIAFLRDKFLADLESGRKVFVFKSASLVKGDLLLLHRVLRSFGPVKLLHVRPTSGQDGGFSRGEAGRIVRIAPDVFVGYLSRDGVTPDGSWDIAFEEWIEICQNVSDALAAYGAVGDAHLKAVQHGLQS